MEQRELQQSLARNQDRATAQQGAAILSMVITGLFVWLSPDWIWASPDNVWWNWLLGCLVLAGSFAGLQVAVDKHYVEKTDKQ